LGGVGEEDVLGSILVGDLFFDYFVGSFFESLVVGVFAHNVAKPTQDSLFMVGKLGLLYSGKKMGASRVGSTERGFDTC